MLFRSGRATWGSEEQLALQQGPGWGLKEEMVKALVPERATWGSGEQQSVGVRDTVVVAQLGGTGIGLAGSAASQRNAPVGSSGAEQAGGQRGPGQGAAVGSGADVRLQGSEPGREHAQAHGKNLQNFETGSQKSVSFEIAEKMQQVWTFSPGESETPSERTPTGVSVDLLEKIPEDTQSKVSTDLLMGRV